MPDVRITEFTDPGCPWAWSAEPVRRRLRWLYGDRLEWKLRMVVLWESAEQQSESGVTPERQAAVYHRIAHDHGMPIDTRVRPRLAATLPACLAVVAVRTHQPDAVIRLLRELRVLHASGALLDDPDTLSRAAAAAGVEPADLQRWIGEPGVAADLAEDMRLAREPMPAARVLDHKLANWSGGRRYTCPSYEIARLADDVHVAVPGFQPFSVYDVITANLVPGLDRREPPASVEEALAWADCPLATKEVAVLCDISLEDARERLGRVAYERHVGADGLWWLKPQD
ncbi:MAG: DsbA family protein [Gaiellales bacterium]